MPDRLFVGREDALDPLREAVEAAIGGRGGAVLITGEPGIGKTAVASEAADQAAARGAGVMWAACWDGEGVAGFWPWTQILTTILSRATSEEAARLTAAAPLMTRLLLERADRGAAEDEAAGARFALFDEIAATLLAQAAAGPLVLVIDDLQWADPASLAVLDFVARRLRGWPLLVIGTSRDVGSVERPLARLLSGACTVLPLRPLSASEVQRLVNAIAGRELEPEVAAGVHRRTGGNPFFVHQVTRLMLAKAHPTPGAAADVPIGVGEAVDRRLAELTPDAVRLLRIAAVLGPEIRPGTIARVAEAHLGLVRDLLMEAVRARVLLPPERPLGAYRFSHHLFREAVYEGLGGAERAGLHLAVGRSLAVDRDEGREVGPAELAHHFLLAVDAGAHREALRWSIAAATDATRRLAYEEAAGHWQRALDVLDASPGGDPTERNEILIELAQARRRAGEAAAARDAYDRALEGARRASDRVRLARSALGLQGVGVATWAPHDELVALLEEAAAALDPEEDAGLLARVLGGLARELAWFGLDRQRAMALVERAVAVARSAGDQRTLASSLVARHNVVWGPGNAAQRLELTREILDLVGRSGDRERLVEARILRASDLLELGDPGFHVEIDELARLEAGLRQPGIRYAVLVRRATQALLSGPVDRAERLIEEAAQLGHEIHEPDAGNVHHAQLFEVRAAQGRRGELMPAMEAWLQQGAMGPAEPWLRAAVLRDRGDRQAAASAAAPLLEMDPAALPRDRNWTHAVSVAAELAAELGADRHRRRAYELLAPYEGGAVTTGAAITFHGAVGHYLGLLAAALGERDRARRHFELALALHERLGARLWILRTRYELARLASSADDRRERDLAMLTEVAEAAGDIGMPELARLAAAARAGAEAARPAAGVFRRRGSSWELGLDGRTVGMPDARGLHDIARLLGSPGEPIPAARLLAAAAGADAVGALRMGADPVLDERSKLEYRARLAELERDVAAAERRADLVRAARARDEREALVEQLAAAAGLGGRARRLGDLSERARKTVTARIRDALRRIEAVHPGLAAHLRASISTGTTCAYTPPTPTSWEL